MKKLSFKNMFTVSDKVIYLYFSATVLNIS